MSDKRPRQPLNSILAMEDDPQSRVEERQITPENRAVVSVDTSAITDPSALKKEKERDEEIKRNTASMDALGIQKLLRAFFTGNDDARDRFNSTIRERPDLGDAALAQAKTTLASGGPSWVRGRALNALQDIVNARPDLAPAILKLSKDALKDPDLRPWAIDDLGRIAELRPDMINDTWPDIKTALKNSNEEVRGHALNTFGGIFYGTPEFRDKLQLFDLAKQGTKDKSSLVRDYAFEALNRMGIWVTEANVSSASELANKLSRTPEIPETVLERAQTALNDKSPDIRCEAIRTIGSVALCKPELAPEAIRLLSAGMKDSDQSVRDISGQSLGTLTYYRPDLFGLESKEKAAGPNVRDVSPLQRNFPKP